MSLSNPTSPKTYPAELQLLLQKASQGDRTVLPELKKAFDEHPELTVQFNTRPALRDVNALMLLPFM
jgi:hypothetical protein